MHYVYTVSWGNGVPSNVIILVYTNFYQSYEDHYFKSKIHDDTVASTSVQSFLLSIRIFLGHVEISQNIMIQKIKKNTQDTGEWVGYTTIFRTKFFVWCQFGYLDNRQFLIIEHMHFTKTCKLRSIKFGTKIMQ